MTPAGNASGARAVLEEVLARHGLRIPFPEPVRREVKVLQARPGIDDPALTDLTQVPFVTIDNPESLDLDQALHIQRGSGGRGYLVQYALADAVHYAPPGSALFAEALLRGVSFYLPGLSVPMLPPQLSEGIVSLNPGVDRRAVVFRMRLDGDGKEAGTELVRGRIRSRAKLSYEGVQAFLDNPDAAPALEGQPYSDSLRLLAEVGRLRLAQARERDVVSFSREEATVELRGSKGEERIVAVARPRNDVSCYNEQLSLLCNSEGGRLLLGEGEPRPQVQPIYRIHEPPLPGALEHLAALTRALAAAHGLVPEQAAWRPRGPDNDPRGESLGSYLDRLRASAVDPRLVAAIERQALVINRRSVYSESPGVHYALGVRPYSRFSAPMREVVGIFTHKEALERLGLLEPMATPQQDEALRERVIAAANSARELQRTLDKEVMRLAIGDLLNHDLALPHRRRPVHAGTIMGLHPAKLYVKLDDPPVELKVYLEDLGRWLGHPLRLDEDGVAVRSDGPGGGLCFLLGDGIRLRVVGYHPGRGKWRLAGV